MTSPWKERVNWLLATCGGFGYSPILPGTAGALWGVAIYVVVALLVDEPWQSVMIGLALVIASAATVRLAPWAEAYFGEEDSGKFVTDEVAGFLLTVLLFRTPDVWVTVVWAFPVTRIIDIIKVPPAKRLERLPAGWGVLADDLLGSLYAAGLLHVIALLRPTWFS
jgi:phosphatidylglycerophosphatase A